jgi:hypothetical protein
MTTAGTFFFMVWIFCVGAVGCGDAYEPTGCCVFGGSPGDESCGGEPEHEACVANPHGEWVAK